MVRTVGQQKKSRRTSKRKRSTKSRKRTVSTRQLERALGVLRQTKDLATAARSIRVSPERFRNAAQRKKAIAKRGKAWRVVARLPRQMPLFSKEKLIVVQVRSRAASKIGRYMAAVGQFLISNDPSPLADFRGGAVKDAAGKSHPFETRPNTLYRLSSAGGEPFEEVYRIVV